MHHPHRLFATTLAALAGLILVPAVPASADSGSADSGTWPAAYPLPTDPGKVISQASARASVRSTDDVATVRSKLDHLYLDVTGCALRLAVNKPRDYLCYNPDTRKTDEIYFTFAALDPTPTDPSHSQSNAFFIKG